MAQDHAPSDHRKGAGEHAVCFGLVIGALLIFAVALQWLLQLTM